MNRFYGDKKNTYKKGAGSTFHNKNIMPDLAQKIVLGSIYARQHILAPHARTDTPAPHTEIHTHTHTHTHHLLFSIHIHNILPIQSYSPNVSLSSYIDPACCYHVHL